MIRCIPELLSPAGGTEAMIAAVQCGADAVYLGAGGFNARQSADNFGGGLRAAVSYCHQRGTKVYVTLNTIVRNDELEALEDTLEEICLAGADGVIVQDIGVARIVRKMAPTMPLHASTQMAVHNAQGVEFLAKQGFRRVVLAREMTYKEIRECADLGAELEVFVHGALCVACSGQCLLSSLIGGRSGNRGRCAQPCRMLYRSGDKQGYLLSTRDLCSLDHFEELIESGAASLKIEGRLKRAEYVALTTRVYRDALDAYRDGTSFDTNSAKEELRQMFNRGGFTEGYGPGVRDAEIMYSKRPNHIGLEIGSCRKNGELRIEKSVDARDTLILRRNDEDIPVHLADAPEGVLSLRDAHQGDSLVRLTSEEQMQAMRRACEGEHRLTELSAELTLRVGEPARLVLQNDEEYAEATGDIVARAQSKPADPDRILTQLQKTGDTPFEITGHSFFIDSDAFIPVSALNALRRDAIARLSDRRSGEAVPCRHVETASVPEAEILHTEIAVQSSDPAQLQRALAAGADRAAFEPDNLRTDALNAALAALPERFDLVLPPVMVEATLRRLHSWALDNQSRIGRVYLSNIAHPGLDWPFEIVADYMLNIANDMSLDQLHAWGVERYTPSVELNREQLKSLGGTRELIVYGRLPLMHLRHCPLRATRGIRGTHADCRRCDRAGACDRVNAMTLTDRTGAAFPLGRLASDEGCVIRLYNSACLMLLRRLSRLPKAAVWRIIADQGDDVEALVRLHRLVLEGGDATLDPAWAAMENMNTTTGHYFRGVE